MSKDYRALFKCKRYKTHICYSLCILRQLKKNDYGSPEYPDCNVCKQGQRISTKFADQMDEIKSEAKKSRQKRAILNTRRLKNQNRVNVNPIRSGSDNYLNPNLFTDLKIALKASAEHIVDMAIDGTLHDHIEGLIQE